MKSIFTVILMVISVIALTNIFGIISPENNCRDISGDVVKIMVHRLGVNANVSMSDEVNAQIKKLQAIDAWADKQDKCTRDAYKGWVKYFKKQLDEKMLPPLIVPVPTLDEVAP